MAQTKTKTETAPATPDAETTSTPAEPNVVDVLKVAETAVVDSLPPSLAKPLREVDTLFDSAVNDACADRDGGRYRLTNVTEDAARKRFRRTINAAVRRIGRETDRVKFVDGETGVYWTVYTHKPRPEKAADNG